MQKIISLLFAFSLIFPISSIAESDTLVASNAVWKYKDKGKNLGTSWRNPWYNDTNWPSGPAQLGYGDGDEATIISYGSDPNNKYITTYFRKTFQVSDPSKYTSLELLLLRDDGAKVFLNGSNVAKSNLPSGNINYLTLAKSGQGASNENKFYKFTVSPSLLINGSNVFAVEVHQASAASEDLGFALMLIGFYPGCTVPQNLSATNITTSSASLNWNPVVSATGYNIDYRIINTSWVSAFTSSPFLALQNLSPGRTYQFRAQAVCGSGSTAWSAVSSFTTLQNSNPVDSLILENDLWKYLDNGSNQGTAWSQLSFNDSGWSTGNAELGYGDGDENTVVGYGPDAGNKYITTYFRKTIFISDPSEYTNLNLGLVRDDGAVIYINGNEAVRSNMPAGAITYTTLTSISVGEPEESTWYNYSIPSSSFAAGANVVAVEIHQSAASSSDISFRLRLSGVKNHGFINTVRGPYLQMVTSASVHVRWKTDVANDSRVRFGTTMDYSFQTDSMQQVTEHEVKLSGLTPGTKYYYTIGSTVTDLQGDPANYFQTTPVTGSSNSFRVWATGDFGDGSAQQAVVRDAFINYTVTNPAHLWIWLGDNAYESGTEPEFTQNNFSVYPSILKNTPVYPCVGNHDYANSGYQSASALGTGHAYFSLFTCPANAEAGGIPSGTEKYYSYNYGNAHFIVLDSYGALNQSGSPMYNWLQADLAANSQRWTVAYWHHPPYSMGTHSSDADIESFTMRQNIVTLLESYNVDMVLSGHSHDYERSVFLRGHYGNENTLTPAMKVDTSSGLAPWYHKGYNSNNGTVYLVCGVSGAGDLDGVQASWPHDAMYSFSNTLTGSVILDFNADTLESSFLTSAGQVFDRFRIVKSAGARKAESLLQDANNNNIFVFPNPYSNETRIFYSLENDSPVSINIYDLAGNKIYFNAEPGIKTAGIQEFIITREMIAKQGFYFIKIITSDKVLTRSFQKSGDK